MSGVEGSASEEGRALSSHESEPSGVASVPNQPSSSRKRAASSSVSELREAIAPDETSDRESSTPKQGNVKKDHPSNVTASSVTEPQSAISASESEE
ncbi:hypothetical protein J5N97_004964 [Dioscorea zingiberensis]|uniref:Uncharacterized protein n=1 Tax=Dioscorea zingiberensis TaxID=325984 RepID=A0A9D5D7L4_9LILI|nr:hypothetical protein J5N97_004964 [Dioscorea zingiberensis]